MDGPQSSDPIPPVSCTAGDTADRTKPPSDKLQRKLDGWCTYSSACPRRAEGWPDPTQQLCRRHRLKEQKRLSQLKRAQRTESAAQGKCVRCRKPSETYRCAACRILDRCTLPSVSRTARDTADRAARIASRTITHADGRTRYHGQSRRGQQTHAQLDEQDIAFALKEIEFGQAGLAQYAYEVQRSKSGDPEAKPRIQRDDLRSAALHQIERAVGHLGDVMERHGHVMQRRDDEGEDG